MRRLIGITLPEYDNAAAERLRITSLIESGKIEYFHIRKPNFDLETMCRYLGGFSRTIRERLCLNDCCELAEEFSIGGVHLNSRNNYSAPEGFCGRISCSCHSIAEVQKYKSLCDYVFLSSVFDSISKQGYKAALNQEELKKAANEGIIDENVFALSGVEPSKFGKLKEMGFCSAAMTGCLWGESKEQYYK